MADVGARPRVQPLTRVLLVCAEDDVAVAVEGLLGEGTGRVAVDRVDDPRAALALLARHRYDCAVVHVSLADHPGRVVEALRAADADLAVLALGGPADAEGVAAAVVGGADGQVHLVGLDAAVLDRAVRMAVLRRREWERLVDRALHDPVTGLWNRLGLLQVLRAAAERAERRGTGTGAVAVDVAGLPAVVAAHGPAAHGVVVDDVVARLHAVARESDVVGRLDVQHFVVVCEDVTVERSLGRLADRVVVALEAPVRLADGEAVALDALVTAASPGPGEGPADLLRRLDRRQR